MIYIIKQYYVSPDDFKLINNSVLRKVESILSITIHITNLTQQKSQKVHVHFIASTSWGKWWDILFDFPLYRSSIFSLIASSKLEKSHNRSRLSLWMEIESYWKKSFFVWYSFYTRKSKIVKWGQYLYKSYIPIKQ